MTDNKDMCCSDASGMPTHCNCKDKSFEKKAVEAFKSVEDMSNRRSEKDDKSFGEKVDEVLCQFCREDLCKEAGYCIKPTFFHLAKTALRDLFTEEVEQISTDLLRVSEKSGGYYLGYSRQDRAEHFKQSIAKRMGK